MEWITSHGTQIMAIIMAAYALARAIVIITPTPKDDAAIEQVGAFLKVIAGIFGLDLKQGINTEPPSDGTKPIVKALVILFSLSILLGTSMTYAAPFVVCDPWTKDGSEPYGFTVTLNGTDFEVAAVPTGTNQVWLHFDLAGKTLLPSNTITCIARYTMGDSTRSVPFVFANGPLLAPSGLSISVK